MNCKNCNAVMRVDHERKVFVCPYCESTEPFEGVSKAELQGMLNDAIKDVRKESMKEAREKLEKEKAFSDNRSAGRKAADTFLFVLQVIACLFLAMLCTSFFAGYVRMGLVSLLQLALMIGAIYFKHRWRMTGEEKYRKRKNLCLVTVGILVIFWFVALLNEGDSGTSDRNVSWPARGLGSELPVPEGTLRYAYSSKTDFSATVKGASADAFEAYVQKCRALGYDVDAEAEEDSYHAYNEDDNELKISYWAYSKEINVQLNKGIEMGEFQWPGAFSGNYPVPEAESSYVKSMRTGGSSNSLEIYVGDVTRQQFMQYIEQCIEAGYQGSYYEGSDSFTGRKGDNASITVRFERGRLLYIDIWETPE